MEAILPEIGITDITPFALNHTGSAIHREVVRSEMFNALVSRTLRSEPDTRPDPERIRFNLLRRQRKGLH